MFKIRFANDKEKYFFEKEFDTIEDFVEYYLDNSNSHIFINEVLEGREMFLHHLKTARPHREAVLLLHTIKEEF